MQNEGVAFSLKELAVGGSELLKEGFLPCRISTLLNGLLMHVAVCPKDNKKERLIKLAHGLDKTISNGAGMR